jgi:conjugative relaxase-like TrwC/TraI family protein
MLSIGRIGSARQQQLYYEQQVANGREDYYAGKGEAPGRWAGSGAQLLGLDGQLDAEKLAALMDGKNPETGEQLAGGRSERSTSAFDLTFSAPKSVSVLFALGDEHLAGQLIAAHEEAVDAAVAYVEDRACQVRRGHNGTKAEREAGLARGWEKARAEPGAGFVAAAYRHRMSRAQDPQLHTHVVAANMARGPEGRWTALYAKPIYEHAKAAGSVYQAHLRHAVRERLRWADWGMERNGMAELSQVPDEVTVEFSTRRRQIEDRAQELAAQGVAVGAEGYQRVALSTREAKREVDEHDWRDTVRARAGEHGLGADELEALLTLPPAEKVAIIDELLLGRRLFGPGGLTAERNTFTEHDLVTAVAAAHAQGGTAGEVIAVAKRMLDSPEVVQIPDTERPIFTTRELLGAEQRILEHADRGRGQHAGVLDPGHVERTLSRLERPLTDEQAAAVTAIAESGNRIDTVEALAGTGKTTSANALREVYEQDGYRVIGAAPTGRAVRELAERAGITESRTLDAWAMKLGTDPNALHYVDVDELGQARRVPAVMIIDEAGMAHTRLSATVMDAAIEARVKVVAIGDSGQLSSVRAGGWLGALTRRNGSHQLLEVMRQRDPHERKGLARLHVGQPDEYVEFKTRRGDVHLFTGQQPGIDAETSAIAQWAAARQQHGAEQTVLICRDNARRNRLNHAARQLLADRGELGEQIEIADNVWAVGDRVIARRNDRGRDLDNGMRGTVIDVDEHRGLTIQIDAGEHRQLDPDYIAEHLEHAYALTGHGMQGGTVQWAGVIGQADDFTRNWSYTALSRARHPSQLLLIDEPTRGEQARHEIAPAGPPRETTPLERLAARMRERDDEDLALEQLEHEQLTAEPDHQTTIEPDTTRQDLAATLETPAEPDLTADTQPGVAAPVKPGSGGTLTELATVRAELDELHNRLADPSVDTAREIIAMRETMNAIRAEADRDRKPTWRRDRRAHQLRAGIRDQQLAELADRERQLLEHVGDPATVLERAARDRERQGRLIGESTRLRETAVVEELATNPSWLEATLGPKPVGRADLDWWQRTAREIASHRIRNDITDPTDPGIRPKDHALARSVADTRTALGLDLLAPDHDQGLGID